jgi:hypothetical protein
MLPKQSKLIREFPWRILAVEPEGMVVSSRISFDESIVSESHVAQQQSNQNHGGSKQTNTVSFSR